VPDVDARFSLANERTFLAWIRTALASIAGGVAAAKALSFDHEVLRWVVAVPPILAGALMAGLAPQRWRSTQQALDAARPIPIGRGVALLGTGLAVYAVVALAAVALD
jgi:putative membrane protein